MRGPRLAQVQKNLYKTACYLIVRYLYFGPWVERSKQSPQPVEAGTAPSDK